MTWQVSLLEISDTKATDGIAQLSASSITTLISGTGIGSDCNNCIAAGSLAVGGISSSTTITCVTSM